MKSPRITILMVCLVLGLGASSQAALLLDFGPTTVTNTDPSYDATVSPAHAEGLPVAQSTWNKVGTADIASGLVYADGTAATGVSLDLGKGDVSLVDFNETPSRDNLVGTVINTGVYSGTRTARDGIFDGTSFSVIGVRIDGLAPGDYTVYMTGRTQT